MKTLIAFLSFIAVAAAIGTQAGQGAPNVDGTSFGFGSIGTGGGGTGGGAAGGAMGDAGASGSVDAVADMGGSSDSTPSETSDDSGSDDDGSDDDGSSDDSSEDTSGSNANGIGLGAMNMRQKSGVAVGAFVAVGAVVGVVGVGYYLYRKRQNGAQMLSNA